MVKQRTAAVLVAAGLLVGRDEAHAHVDYSPQVVNRYVWVLARPDNVEIRMDLFFGELPAAEERARIDANRDGRLQPAELQAARKRWSAELPPLLRVQIDGEQVPLSLEAEIDLGGRDGVGGQPLQVAGRALKEVRPRVPHRIRVELGSEPPRPGESEIRFEAARGWELASSRRATGADERSARFTFDQPRIAAVEDRSVEFVMRPMEGSGPASDTGRKVALAAGLAAFAAAVALVRRRARRKADDRPAETS